jgi:parallel beta-helix repeat protein
MLRNNAMDSNGCNFGVYGDLPSHFLNDVDASNTVDGKPVYYWINRQDMEIPSDCGCLALVNCTHITAKNLKITNNLEGILLVSTTNSTISGNNITANDVHGVCLLNSSNNTMSGNNITANRIDGIDLGDSSDNTMSENNITNSDFCGIQLGHSSNNTITGNNITNNDSGIELGSSSNNTITGNNITTNWLGIKLGDSSNNTLTKNKMANNQIGIEFMNSSNNIIYSNNFVDNTARQAYIYSYVSNNVWDNGYPSGGNYWSDYNGVDTNHDGLGDTQYIIDANNTDHYPLMNIIPEFPSLLILPLFFIATLLAVIIYKREKV